MAWFSVEISFAEDKEPEIIEICPVLWPVMCIMSLYQGFDI